MGKNSNSLITRAIGIAQNLGIRYLILSAYWYFSERLLGKTQMTLAYPTFKELSKTTVTKEQALDFAFSFKRYGFSIRPQQSRKELSLFLSLAEKEKPKVILEIGIGSGGTLFLLTRIALPNAILVSIDLHCPNWRNAIIESFSIKDQKLQLFIGNSNDLSTFYSIQKYLNENKIDLLFIDGGHKYEEVKTDFELYSQLVREGGLIAFHDIADNFDPDTQVPKFWDEIKKNYRHIEIIEKKGTPGIGIIYLKSRSCTRRT